jgi:hypothetical protein
MAVLLIPLFFLNVRSSHDWGGDFAGYIMQARNIVEGVPQSETPYIYNPDNAVLGPPAYPIGFPLLLSPVYAIAGNSIMALTLWVTAFLYGAGLLMTLYLRRYFNDLITFFLVLIVIYNPYMLFLKAEVMSEFPFIFFLLLCLLLFEKYSRGPFWVGIVIAFLGGLLMSIRVIGVVFPLAVLIWAVRKRFFDKDKTPMTRCVCGFLVGIGSILVYLVLSNLIFVVPQAEGGSYIGIWGGERIYETILNNLAYYVEQFKYFFSAWGGLWNFLPFSLKAVIFTFTIIGMIKSFSRRLELLDMIVILYLGVLIIYPYRMGGVRFLIPVIPILVYYLVKGLETVSIFPKISQTAKTVFLGSLVLVSYLGMVWFIINTQHQVLEGPYEETSVEAFSLIKEETEVDDVILFVKPRVLALYTDRKSLTNYIGRDVEGITDLIRKYDVAWVLTHTQISDEAIKNFIREQDNVCEYYWSNDKFVLYKVIQ